MSRLIRVFAGRRGRFVGLVVPPAAHILSKNKKYPGISCSIEHGWKFIAVQCMFGNMDYFTIWLCGSADHFGFWCQWWMMRHFKHKRSQIKIAESECKKKCFHVNEIANWVNNISNGILMNQYSQNCSAAIASAKKVLNSDLSCSNSGYNGVSIGNSICYEGWTNTFPS